MAGHAQSIHLLPEVLFQYEFSAPQYLIGGEIGRVELVKYPKLWITDPNLRNEIDAVWKTWWQQTVFSRDPERTGPLWGSPSRSGNVWDKVGEAAHRVSGHPYVFCYNCGFALAHPGVSRPGGQHSGTKSIRRHHESLTCQAVPTPVHIAPEIVRRNQIASPVIPAYSTTAFEEELVRVVIGSNWAFRTVEQPSFHRFIRFLRPDAVITSRYKFRLMFEKQFDIAHAAILKDLEPLSKISISLDGWSAANHLGFLAVKGYYINQDWVLCERLLDFIPLRGRHTGSSMAADLMIVLSNTKTESNLLAITSDNASNNGTLTKTLQEKLAYKGISWNRKENSIPCMAHVINLVVQDIIHNLQLAPSEDLVDAERLEPGHIEDVSYSISVPNSLRKLRAICILIDSSPQRFERFLLAQRRLPAKQRLCVIRDVKTRWNSTFDMCERALALQQYIDEWLLDEIALKSRIRTASQAQGDISGRDLQRLRLDRTEWKHLRMITKMLAHFKTATEFLSKNDVPQITDIWSMYNKLFDFLDLIVEDLDDDDPRTPPELRWPAVVRAAAEAGREKLRKYYSKTDAESGYLFNCATILDPTQKLDAYVGKSWEDHYKAMYELQFFDYIGRYERSGRSTQAAIAIPGPPLLQRNEWFRPPPTQSPLSSFVLSEEAQIVSGSLYAEAQAYLDAPVLRPRQGYTILQWWKENSAQYPTLALVAKDILAIPIAQVGVERVFNTAKDVIGDRRHRLSAKTIQRIMVLHDSFREEATQGPQDEREQHGVEEDRLPCDEVDDLVELDGDQGLTCISPEVSIVDEEASVPRRRPYSEAFLGAGDTEPESDHGGPSQRPARIRRPPVRLGE